MAGARATLLCCVLLAAPQGLCLCCSIKLLEGLKDQSFFFPALQHESVDIVRVTWRFQGSHIAEIKPREKMSTINYLPNFYGRLVIHPSNLSLEIRPLQLADSGSYVVVMDTLSDPTNPKTFSYLLLVCDDLPGTGGVGGQSRSTAEPRGPTEPWTGDITTEGAGGGEPPGGSSGMGVCRAPGQYCVVKGYCVAAVFGPLLILVATVHFVTRDKATKLGGEVPMGPRTGFSPPNITTPQQPSPWQ
ncbi:uncharacterized protein LOC142048288 [Phalacrocorax aristotelis]|uniref:uncharacterized protein LOC142048288 n=1 Tax=Phalacrocorax aristotelis TaxID=126867 RepID=UPI003F4B7A3E